MGPEQPFMEIYSACWWVRHYSPPRTAAMRLKRAQAIRRLGLTLREAFNRSDDFETLLTVLVDGLNTKETKPF